MCLIKGSVSYP
uniref:Uncharacterized protein n=1 Tax=Arundo donax TaxID=35708 RepID=A0A0A8Y0W1_ARUDO